MPCVVLRFHPFFVQRRAKRAQHYDPLANYTYDSSIDLANIAATPAQPSSLTAQFQSFSPDDTIQIQHSRLPFSEPDSAQLQSLEPTANTLDGTVTTSEMPNNDMSADYQSVITTVAPVTGLARFRQKLQTGAAKVKEAHQAPVVEQLDIKPARFKRRMSHDDLLNEESRLGSTIFGPIPVGHHREFFHDHNNVWIWYESWRDANRRQRQITVRYEIRPTGVYKKFTAGKYIPLEGAELYNFRKATHAYLKVIREGLYGQTAPATIATV